MWIIRIIYWEYFFSQYICLSIYIIVKLTFIVLPNIFPSCYIAFIVYI